MEPTALDTMYPTMTDTAQDSSPIESAGAGSLSDKLYPTMQPEAETQAAEDRQESKGDKAPDQGEKKSEPRAPAEYAELTIPEGIPLNEQAATEYKGLAKEQDLTQEQAEKLLEYGGAKAKVAVEALRDQWFDQQRTWEAQVIADPEIGGAENIWIAQRIFEPGKDNPFVNNADEAKALKAALNMTGAGSNPAFVRLFVRAGNFMSRRMSAGPNTTRQAAPRSLASKLYPKMER
jgi:hypothetical protein